LTAEQIAGLNRHIEKDLKTLSDITRIPMPYSGSVLAAALQKDIDRLRPNPVIFHPAARHLTHFMSAWPRYGFSRNQSCH